MTSQTIPIRAFRPRRQWRWWLKWGHNETALMYPKMTLNVAISQYLPPDTMLMLNALGDRVEYVWVGNLGT